MKTLLNNKIFIVCLIFIFTSLLENAEAQTTKTVGFGGDYTTLKLAFDAINNGSITGNITLQIISNTTETVSASLNASGSGSANYNSVNIYPTISGISITGDFNNPLISLNGADNITVDGRVNATGATNDLTFINSNTGNFSSAIRFTNSAESNIVKYCDLKSSCYSTGVGLINFTSSSAGNGNDNNVIEYCNITNAGGNRPLNVIFSSGGAGRENSENIIRNNNFYDFFNPNADSKGITLSYLSTNWTITGNSFYETTTFVPTGAYKYYSIFINTGTHCISNNYIGGSSPLCAGSAWTVNANTAHYFCGIFMNGGASTPGIIENNVIQNIKYTSIEDNPWDGIFVNSGLVNVTGNTVGATTGNNSILITTPVAVATATISGGVVTAINLIDGGSGYTTAPIITFSVSGSTTHASATTTISGGVVTAISLIDGGSGYTAAPNVVFDGQTNIYSTSHGLINASTATVNISNNNFGSITTVGSSYYSHGFETMYIRGAASITNISNNLIGSLTTSNSIQTLTNAASSLQKQDIYGIYSSSTGTTTISGNTIANLFNAYAGVNSGSRTRGIQTIAGTNIIENNVVRNISTASAQTSTKSAASVIGISQTANKVGTTQTISGNTIYNLSNTNSTARTDIYGIYYSGPTTGTNLVSGNFIHSLSFSSANVLCDMDGIVLYNGLTTCANNIINLGKDVVTGYKINGIWDDGSATNNNNIYFNSIYIGGTISSGVTSLTSALNCANNASTKNYVNNILFNARSGGTVGKHYAIVLSGIANLTIDYNDFFVSGSGGVLGKIGSLDKTDIASWKLATSQDINSLSINPVFSVDGGTSALDYYTSAALSGVAGTGILNDFAGLTRGATPKMGALEINNYTWQGSISDDFGTAANWTGGVVPPNGADITFASNPDNNCVLDQNRTLGSITNAQATDKLIINGKQLVINGNIDFSNGAQIDGTAEFSSVVFSGSTVQSIPSGSFVSNVIDTLTINNINGLILNSDFTINKGIALIAGIFAIGPNTLTFNGVVTAMTGTVTGGSATNMIIGGNGASINMPSFLLNNLTINRVSGVSLYGDLSIEGALSLTNGTLTVGANILTLSGSSPIRTNGNIDVSNSGATLNFTNASAITLPPSIFTGNVNNLTINGAGGITSNSDFTINGVLNLQSTNPSSTKGSLDMWDGAAIKTLTMGADATTIGIGDVIGIVKRNSFVANVVYTFGNPYTTVTFPNAGTLPTEWKFKITLGNAPSWKTGATQRIYDIVRTGGTGSLPTVKLHYQDSELNSNNEANLVFFGYLASNMSVTEYGKVNEDITNNWVSLSGSIEFAPENFGEREWTLSEKELPNYTWLGVVPGQETDWNANMNWSGGSVPTSTSDVLIPAGCDNYPTLPSNTSINSISIENSAILNGGTSTTLSINGSNAAWYNRGTFNSETSSIIFTNAAATMSGETNFYNLTINSGAGLTLTTNNIMRIANNLINNGSLDATVFPNTIEYNGGSQTVIIPNGATMGYHHLILSGSGNKTMPSSSLNIDGDLSTSGTASVSAASTITVAENFTIDAGSTFIAGNYTHYIGGGFDNNGTYTASTGNTITMNGSSIQYISGTATTNFYNLIINNNSGVSLYTDITVENVLTLVDGNLKIEESTLGINGTISKSSGFIEASSLSSLSFGGTDAISIPNSLFTPIFDINNLTINRSGGVTLGNQNLIINGLLNLVSGNLLIGANTLTIAGISPTRTNGQLDASNANATLIFINNESIILPSSIFTGNVNNLTINGLGGITAISDFSIDGILNLQSENPSAVKGSLDMIDGTVVKTLTMGANATTIGIGDVTGIIKRTTINSGVIYSFGSQYMTVYFPNDGTIPSEMSAKISIGTAPLWRTGAIEREIEIIQTGGSATKAVFSYHYLDTELNENQEDKLVLWVGLNPTNYEYGRSAYNAADNWVSLSNVNVAFFSSSWDGTKNVTLDENSTTTTLTWNGSLSNSWTSIENWTPSVGPSSDKNIIIPDASTTLNSPTLPAFTEIKTLTIEAAGVLNAAINAQLTINGSGSSWSNIGGTFNSNTSNVIFSNKNATISGTTNFYNVAIPDTVILWLTSGSIMRIAGTITNYGVWRTVTNGSTTVEYNGGDQTIVTPNPSTNRYSTLILSGNGTKTMPSTALNIEGDLVLSGTSNTTAAANISIAGNLTIESGSSFNPGNYNHSIGGNFCNNWTFVDGGTSVTFNGSSNQSISGTAISTFYDLVINNMSGVSLEQSIIVSNNLSLTDGALDLNSKTLTINNNSASAITRTSGYIVSEKTNNSSKLKWNIGSTVATYTFPFGTATGTYIPFIMNHTAGDIGNVTVSTYPTAVDNTPYPTSPDIVTNVNDFNGFDNSANTVDRFWQIDKDGPAGTATLTFTAASAEVNGINNLSAQRWNKILQKWDNPLVGQSNTANSVTVPGVTSFSPWTLAGNGSFLPITMLSFTVARNNDYAHLQWVTATEVNNSGFEIEKSIDMKEWQKIGFLSGAGNSNQILKYEYDDLLSENIQHQDAQVYYRLKQIDFNGAYKYSDIRAVNIKTNSEDNAINFTIFPNPASQFINIVSNESVRTYQVAIYNQNGSMLISSEMNSTLRLDVSDLSPTAYLIIITDKLNAKQFQYKMMKVPE